MKICVDLSAISAGYSGGVSTFAMGLTRGLVQAAAGRHRVAVLVTRHNREHVASDFARGELELVEISDEWGGHRYLRGLLAYLGRAVGTFKLPYLYDRTFRRRRTAEIDGICDAVIVPTTVLNATSHRVPTVLCVHDIQHEYHPEFFSRRELFSRHDRYRLSCWAASAVQASSRFVKTCLLEKFDFLDPERVFVAPEGVDFERFHPAAPNEMPDASVRPQPGSFLFYPAQLWPHKNHLLLIDALATFRSRHGYEVPCILTGQDYGMGQCIAEAISQQGLEKVRHLGRVPFRQLLWLYANCVAVLALGLHESSSLPLREGAAFGKPLICSDIPPNLELDGKLSLLTFDRHSSESLLSIVERLQTDRARLTAEAAANVAAVRGFEWRVVAQAYIETCMRLVAQRTSTAR